METIQLFPSNWLYNASVIGLLTVLVEKGGENIEDFFKDEDGNDSNGVVNLRLDIFKKGKEKPKALEFYYSSHTTTKVL